MQAKVHVITFCETSPFKEPSNFVITRFFQDFSRCGSLNHVTVLRHPDNAVARNIFPNQDNYREIPSLSLTTGLDFPSIFPGGE